MVIPLLDSEIRSVSPAGASIELECQPSHRVFEVIERTLTSRPAHATQWALRSMAKEVELSNTSSWRIWGAFGLQPHRAPWDPHHRTPTAFTTDITRCGRAFHRPASTTGGGVWVWHGNRKSLI